MSKHTPKGVTVEVGGEERILVASLYGLHLAMRELEVEKMNDLLQVESHRAVPVLVWAFTEHEGRDETVDDVEKLIGFGEVEGLMVAAAKAMQAGAPDKNPTKAKASRSRSTGTNSKPSQSSTSA